MAGRTLVCHRGLAMVPLGRLPATRAMTTQAIGRGRYMGRPLARGSTAVVAASAIGCACESAVVWLGRSP